jgi:hypothetical protein
MAVVSSQKLRQQRESGWCEERESLSREWQDAAEVYTKALAEIIRKIDTIPELELVKLGRITEAARKITALLHSELKKHIETHHCD